TMLNSSKGLDRDLFLEANNTFHKALREAAQSPRLKVIISRLISQPVVSRTAMSYERSDLERSNEHHAELVEAIAAKDGDWAHSVMTSHILAALQIYKRFYLQEETVKTKSNNGS
ncbi:MAG: FCD domain-containing protein, partial [Sphingomonadales bacterium]